MGGVEFQTFGVSANVENTKMGNFETEKTDFGAILKPIKENEPKIPSAKGDIFIA